MVPVALPESVTKLCPLALGGVVHDGAMSRWHRMQCTINSMKGEMVPPVIEKIFVGPDLQRSLCFLLVCATSHRISRVGERDGKKWDAYTLGGAD